MFLQVQCNVVGARRWPGKDGRAGGGSAFVLEDQQQNGDSVGQRLNEVRCKPELIDSLRHRKLPALISFRARMETYGRNTVLVLDSVDEPAPASPLK